MVSRSLAALLVAALLLAGCTGSPGSGAGSAAGPAAPGGTASLLVGMPVTRLALEGIDTVRYAGFDAAGAVVFRGVERQVAGTHLLAEVPTDTTLLQVEYVDGGEVEGLGHHEVDLSAGGTATIPQAEFAAPGAALASLAVTPRAERVAAGTANQFQATATLDDGRVLDYTRFVFWTSSNAAVASLGLNTGVASGLSPGTATITIRQAGLTSTGTVEVTNATLVRLDVLPRLPGVILGVPQPLQALGSFSDGTRQDLTTQVAWDSSDVGVVTVTPQGVATGVAVGSADATATFGAVQSGVPLDVHDSSGMTVQVESPEAFLADGTVTQARAFAAVPDGTRQDVTLAAQWTATAGILGVGTALDRQGFVTALAPGTGSVTATLGSASGSASIEVTSETITAISLDPPNALSAPGTRRTWRVLADVSDGKTQDVTRMVSFASSDPALVDLSNFSSERGVGHIGGPEGQTATVSTALPGSAITCDGSLYTGLYVYLVSEIFGQVMALKPNLADGQLTFLEDHTGTESPDDLIIHPNGLFVYVLNYDTDSVSTFAVAPGTGLLTELGDSPVPDCTCSSRLAIDPQGHYLYVPTGLTEDITLFAIDPDNGTLTDLGVAQVCGGQPVDAHIRPDGRFLYLSDASSETIWIYEVDPRTGALSAPTQMTPGFLPEAFAIDPLGRFAWLTNLDVKDLQSFVLDPWTGAWTPAAPPATTPGFQPASITVDPKARFVYTGTIDDGSGRGQVSHRAGCGEKGALRVGADVADCGCEDAVEGFEVGGDGGLFATVPPSQTALSYPNSMAVDPTGRFAWAASYTGGGVSGYAIDQVTGALSALVPRDLSIDNIGLFHIMATP